jgi:hypothetical protein
MLNIILTALTISLTLFLLAFRRAIGRSARRETVYVCDICNEQDCLCSKKH